MSKASAKIHLDKSEFLVISGIVFLFAGLMFSVGVMVGVGLNPSVESAQESEDHDSDHAVAAKGHGKEHGEKASRKIASEHGPSKMSAHSESDEKIYGKKLKEDYRKSKQSEFEEMLANQGNDDGEAPTSAMDSQAYFLSRENKHEEDQDLPLNTKLAVEEEERQPASVGKKGAVPNQVKGLFERKPASANDYAPVFGEYTVLVSSFASQDEAISKLGALRIAGFDDAYFKKERLNGSDWYRVGVGSFKDLKWALKTKESLKKKALAPTPIVRKVE